MTWSDIRTDKSFKENLANQTTVVGCFVMVSGAQTVEMCGLAGCDFVFIDTEHTPVGWEQISAMVISALYTGMTPIIRTTSGNRELVTRAFDSGARGIMVPQINNRQEAPVVYDVSTVTFIVKCSFLLSATSIYDGDTRAIILPKSHCVDIDTEDDISYAEFLLAKRSES